MRQTVTEHAADLIARIEAAGITRPSIVRQTGLSKNTIWRMANQQGRQPTYSTVRKLEKLAEKVKRG